MNLIEAIKSGRPFKRRHWSEWLTEEKLRNLEYGVYADSRRIHRIECLPDGISKLAYMDGPNQWGVCIGFDTQDIVADDWEIKERTITITRTQLIKECINALQEVRIDYQVWGDETVGRYLAKRLGLEENE